MVKVSVVIPTYNRAKLLYRTLYTLFKQHDENYEVLVSNDDDLDKYQETEAVVHEFQALGMPIQYFYTGQYKRGSGWSLESYPYNVGIKHASGDIIILNSGDVMSVNNTIDRHRQELISNENFATISTVHAITALIQDSIDSYNWKEDAKTLLFKGSCYKMFTGYGTSYTESYPIEDAGAPYHFQMGIWKKHLHEIRGFDEDFYGLMPCGDDDLANRLKIKGITFKVLPEALAIHQFHGGPSDLSKNIAVINNIDGHNLFWERQHSGIIRNGKHEWGQYPRDMKNLPQMSGVME